MGDKEKFYGELERHLGEIVEHQRTPGNKQFFSAEFVNRLEAVYLTLHEDRGEDFPAAFKALKDDPGYAKYSSIDAYKPYVRKLEYADNLMQSSEVGRQAYEVRKDYESGKKQPNPTGPEEEFRKAQEEYEARGGGKGAWKRVEAEVARQRPAMPGDKSPLSPEEQQEASERVSRERGVPPVDMSGIEENKRQHEEFTRTGKLPGGIGNAGNSGLMSGVASAQALVLNTLINAARKNPDQAENVARKIEQFLQDTQNAVIPHQVTMELLNPNDGKYSYTKDGKSGVIDFTATGANLNQEIAELVGVFKQQGVSASPYPVNPGGQFERPTVPGDPSRGGRGVP